MNALRTETFQINSIRFYFPLLWVWIVQCYPQFNPKSIFPEAVSGFLQACYFWDLVWLQHSFSEPRLSRFEEQLLFLSDIQDHACFFGLFLFFPSPEGLTSRTVINGSWVFPLPSSTLLFCEYLTSAPSISIYVLFSHSFSPATGIYLASPLLMTLLFF